MSYAKLRGKIREVFGTDSNFAAALGKNPSTVSAKLNKKSAWTREEMETSCKLLGIPIEEVRFYFFAEEL